MSKITTELLRLYVSFLAEGDTSEEKRMHGPQDIIDQMTGEIDAELRSAGTSIESVGTILGEYDRLRAAAVAASKAWQRWGPSPGVEEAMERLRTVLE